MSTLAKRIATGLVLLGVLLGSYYFFGVISLKIITFFFLILSTYEILNCIKVNKKKLYWIAPLVCLLLITITFFNFSYSYFYFFIVLLLGLMLSVLSQTVNKSTDDIIKSLSSEYILILFVGVFGSLSLYALNDTGQGAHFFALIFLSSFGCDTGAYFSGRLFGKKLLFPVVSPKKTWAGVYGGISASVVVSIIYIFMTGMELPYPLALLLLAFSAMATVTGDLILSLVKRVSGIKDYGTVFPGHGGVLDRIDGALMAAPFIYLLVFWI